ncbi:MAG TPA: T9SS type A sorting domain-containing protein [Bacteroidia bacterium]|jgi:hypothetical protein
MKKIFLIGSIAFSFKMQAQDTLTVQSEHAGTSVTILNTGTLPEDTYSESSYTEANGGTVTTLVNTSSSSRKVNSVKQEDLHFSIYPNPSSGVFNINSYGVSMQKIEIANVLGETIKTVPLNSSFTTLDISQFPKGVYFVKAYSPGGSIKTGKVIYQ